MPENLRYWSKFVLTSDTIDAPDPAMGPRGVIVFRDNEKTRDDRGMFYLALGFLIGAAVVLAVVVYYWVMGE